MRSFVALLVFFGSIVGSSSTVTAADTYEPTDPFRQPEPTSRSVAASISDGTDAEK